MLRSSFAVIAGIFVWGLVATVGNWIVRAALPGYSAVEAAMAFRLPMLLCRLALGLVSSLCAGAVCAAAAVQESRAVAVAAGLLLLLFLPVHYSFWSKFPLWYHVFFLASLVPATLFGAVVYRRLVPRAMVRREALEDSKNI
jgi:hypothetical protein